MFVSGELDDGHANTDSQTHNRRQHPQRPNKQGKVVAPVRADDRRTQIDHGIEADGKRAQEHGLLRVLQHQPDQTGPADIAHQTYRKEQDEKGDGQGKNDVREVVQPPGLIGKGIQQ